MAPWCWSCSLERGRLWEAEQPGWCATGPAAPNRAALSCAWRVAGRLATSNQSSPVRQGRACRHGDEEEMTSPASRSSMSASPLPSTSTAPSPSLPPAAPQVSTAMAIASAPSTGARRRGTRVRDAFAQATNYERVRHVWSADHGSACADTFELLASNWRTIQSTASTRRLSTRLCSRSRT